MSPSSLVKHAFVFLGSDLDYVEPTRDLFGSNQIALARSRTNFASSPPRFRRSQVALPERPGPALTRSHGVDRAAGRPVVKDAVAVVLFAQRPAAVGQVRIKGGGHGDGFGPVLGNSRDLLIVDPDESGR